VTTYRRIPFSWKKIFGQGSFLKIEISFVIEKVEVDDRMKQFAFTIMTDISGCTEDLDAVFIDNWENFHIRFLYKGYKDYGKK